MLDPRPGIRDEKRTSDWQRLREKSSIIGRDQLSRANGITSPLSSTHLRLGLLCLLTNSVPEDQNICAQEAWHGCRKSCGNVRYEAGVYAERNQSPASRPSHGTRLLVSKGMPELNELSDTYLISISDPKYSFGSSSLPYGQNRQCKTRADAAP